VRGKVFENKRAEVREKCRKLHNEYVRNLYASSMSLGRLVKEVKRDGTAVHVAIRNAEM
jgi:hypothetical protein